MTVGVLMTYLNVKFQAPSCNGTSSIVISQKLQINLVVTHSTW